MDTGEVEKGSLAVRPRKPPQICVVARVASVNRRSVLLASGLIYEVPAIFVLAKAEMGICVQDLTDERQQSGACQHQKVGSVQVNVTRWRHYLARRVQSHGACEI